MTGCESFILRVSNILSSPEKREYVDSKLANSGEKPTYWEKDSPFVK